MQRLLLVAIPLSGAAAFTSLPPRYHAGAIKTTTSLDAVSRRDVLSSFGFAAAAASIALPNAAFASGAYQAEAGFDDFSGGLTMPAYNVDNAGQLGLSTPKEADPEKLAKLQAKKEAAAAAAKKKAEAAAAKKAAAMEAEAAKLEAAAAKQAAKEEAKKRQMANMSAQQRAKMEAYEAKKAEEKKQGSAGYAMDSMKKMYGL